MFRLDFEGGEDLERALADLPGTTARASARRMLKAAGELIARRGAANAPKREGDLARSYGVGTKLTTRQRRMHRKMERAKVEVFVGPGEGSYKAAVQTEFGNEHQAAEPHLRPAFDAEKQNALDLIARDWWADIEKTWARVMRKRARQGR